ncbi:type VI secretion system baseplate subunit TssE [Erwinia amylovora]
MDNKIQFPPTLLDRLIDEEPRRTVESFDKFFFTSRDIRSIVQRDLSDLLNCTNVERGLNDDKYKAIKGSVINYGVCSLAGGYPDVHRMKYFESSIRTSILRFETRIIPESLFVRHIVSGNEPMRNGVILFEIRGLIYWEPHPIDFHAKYGYDTEVEKVTLSRH